MRISDWSSDVCSSDLRLAFCQANRRCAAALGASPSAAGLRSAAGVPAADRATYLMTETGIDLTGQVAIVTGGGGGIGRACALRLADFGADLVIADILPERNAEVRSEEHTSELQSLMRISYAAFSLKKQKTVNNINNSSQKKIQNTVESE